MDSNNVNDESISLVNECVEHLQKLLKLKQSVSPATYVATIKNLLHVVSSQEKAMKHFASPNVGGIPLVVSLLEQTQDLHIKQMVVLIIKEMLSRKSARSERALLLASSGATNSLLKLVVKSHQPFNFTDDFVSSLYSITAKIGKRDKKFAMRARLFGVLPVITTHIRFYALRPKVLNSVLMFLKRVLISAVNAIQLSKADLIPHLLTFLDPPKKKMTLSVMYSLEAIALATRSKNAARQFVKQEVTEHLLQVLANMNHTAGMSRIRTSRMLRAYNAILHTLVHMTQIKSGRESLCLAGAIPIILNWCQSICAIPGSQWDRLVTRASVILQRCLSPHPLPVSKFHSPFVFNLPEQSIGEHLDYAESKAEVSDSDSQVSSNSSSFESDGDSDQHSDPFTDNSGINSGEYIRQFRSFFEELKEDKEVKPSAQNPSVFYDKCIELEEELVFESHKPESFQKLCTVSKQSVNHPVISVQTSPAKKNKCDNSVGDHTFCANKTSPPSTSSRGDHNSSSIECSSSKIFSCVNISKRKPERKSVFTTREVKNLLESAKEETRSEKFLATVNTCEVYQNLAPQTSSVLPFVKIAYPDMKSCISCDECLVKLETPKSGLVRTRILKHMYEMTNKETPCRDIYNLDYLVNRSGSPGTSLTNTDEERITSPCTYEHLTFESRFESGNLRKVFWKGAREYDLILNPDVNSMNHHQWFYFEVFGMKAGVPYIFNIINMEKTTSLFSDGMCPVMYSVKSHVQEKRGWMRSGLDICYFRNHYIQGASTMSSLRDKPYYTLTFSIIFPFDNDVCYLAYHYPYTYTALQTQLECWMSSYDTTSVYCKKDELCKTLGGNSVPLITITAKPTEGHRPYIFLTARVHPGESNSSWAMKGTLDFLFSNKPSAQRVREKFIFKIVPMLNADGVINGCHRCSLTGQDLNRQWITPNIVLHPTIYHAKSLMYFLNSMGRKPLIYCDYHGHSRRHNVFLYGCNPEQSWWSSDESKPDCESFKIIPLLMHQMVPSFGLEQCCFNIERSRESTARVTVWRQFDVVLSYTMECTYGGCDQGLYAGYHIGISQLEETGTKLCQCFGKIEPSLEKNSVISCSIPIDLSMLPKSKSSKSQEPDSFSSSLSEDDLVEFEEGDQQK